MPRDNSVSDLEDAIRELRQIANDIMQGRRRTASDISRESEKTSQKISEQEKASAKETNKIKDASENIRAKIQQDAATKAGEIIKKKSKEAGQSLGSMTAQAFDSAFSSITSKYKQYLTEYTNQQQKLAFNLLGSGIDYDVIRDSLSALSTSSYIRQRDVYNNLTNLVSSGITMNAAQRAFLQTASDQVSLGFQTNEASLNRLIQLQEMDLSEARMAQMAGLKTFLEQNYQNSQYIKEGFSQVSASLLEMQSLMSAQMAMSTEKTIQTYLGAFSSSGGSSSSVSAIAQALGAIGSGDFSGLSEGMQNLMVMAASRAGLSYADLLLNGLDNNKSEQLMTRLLSYVADMSNMGGGSNVAMNAVAKMFGVTVSDIRAAQQMGIGGINVNNVNSDIATFLTNLATSTNRTTQASTLYDNLISNRAMYGDLLRYETEQGLFSVLGSLVGGIPLVGGILGPLVSNRPGLGVMNGVFSDAGGITNIMSGIGDILSSSLSSGVSGILSLFGGGNVGENILNAINRVPNSIHTLIGNILDKMIENVAGDSRNLISDYYWFDTNDSLYSTGIFSNAGVGTATSGRASNRATTGTTGVTITSTPETENISTGDLYSILVDSSSTPYTTISNIIEANNTVLIGSQEITNTITESLTTTALMTQNIYLLLESWYSSSSNPLLGRSLLEPREDLTVIRERAELLYGDWTGSGKKVGGEI